MSLFRAAFCPVCGMIHGQTVLETPPGKPHIALRRGNYWDKVSKFDPNKPFGVIQETTGRGTFSLVGYFTPEEDTDGYFPLVKARLLQATKDWIAKGWISREEVEEMLGAPIRERRPEVKVTQVEAAIPEAAPVDLEEKLSEIQTILDEENKAKSIARLEKALAGIDEDMFEGIEDIETAIEEYRGIEKSGKSPEDYRSEKEEAFGAIQEALDNLTVAEEG